MKSLLCMFVVNNSRKQYTNDQYTRSINTNGCLLKQTPLTETQAIHANNINYPHHNSKWLSFASWTYLWTIVRTCKIIIIWKHHIVNVVHIGQPENLLLSINISKYKYSAITKDKKKKKKPPPKKRTSNFGRSSGAPW